MDATELSVLLKTLRAAAQWDSTIVEGVWEKCTEEPQTEEREAGRQGGTAREVVVVVKVGRDATRERRECVITEGRGLFLASSSSCSSQKTLLRIWQFLLPPQECLPHRPGSAGKHPEECAGLGGRRTHLSPYTNGLTESHSSRVKGEGKYPVLG